MTTGDQHEAVADTAGSHSTLFALAGGNVAQVGARLLLGVSVPLVLVEFETSKARIGLALTGMWAIYALLQFPSGVLSDRYGERPLVLLGLTGTVAGSLLVAIAPSLSLYGAFVLLLGAGTGLYFAPATALVSRLYEAQGAAISALTAGSAVAGVVFPIAGGLVGVRFGWRPAVALGATGAVPALLGSRRLLPATAPANPDRALRAAVDAGRLRELLTRPSIVFVILLAVGTAFAFQAVASFLPTLLVEHRGLDTGTAGVVFGAVFGISSVSQVVAGRVSDARSRDLAIGASVVLTVAGILVLLTVPGRGGLFVGLVVLGIGISWPGPMQARIIDHLGEGERAYGYGLIRTVYMLLAASGSIVVGTLADVGGWVVGFGSVVGILCVCILLLVGNRVLGFNA